MSTQSENILVEQELGWQAPNIDEEGKVLYLDEGRTARKEMGFELFHNHPKGLGIFDFVKTHVSARKWNWGAVLTAFRIIVKGSEWMRKEGLKSRIYKKLMMFSPPEKHNTTAIVMPLNIDDEDEVRTRTLAVDMDITDKSEKCVIPVDIIKEALQRTDFIGAMNSCLCRDAHDCQSYPHDLACLFLGKSGKVVVEHGLARQITYEEAMDRVRRAAEVGLVGQSLWVEVEQLIWGFKNEELDHFIEICFCCPCCCVGMNLSRNASPDIKRRFHSVGWTCVPDRTKCIGCGKCLEVRCPQDALRIAEDGRIEVNQEWCVGCGICKEKCAQGALSIRQTMPMRENMHEYFLKDFSLDLKFRSDE